MTPEELLALLHGLGIAHRTIRHQPLLTVAQSKQHRADACGGYTKNLFLRNRKGAMWLVTCHEDRRIDLKALGRMLSAGRLSFCSARRLQQYLGVVPGAVSPFAVVNDRDAQVSMVLERALLAYDRLHLHPLDNARTTTIAAADLTRFLHAVGHPPHLVELA